MATDRERATLGARVGPEERDEFCVVHDDQGVVFSARHVAGTAPGDLCLELTGELDLHAASVFGPLLERAVVERTAVELRVAGLRFLDSSGLVALVRAMSRVDEQQGTFRLVGPSPAVLRVLEVTGTERLLGPEGDGRS